MNPQLWEPVSDSDAFLLERFNCLSCIKPNSRLIDKLVKDLIEFAFIAA